MEIKTKDFRFHLEKEEKKMKLLFKIEKNLKFIKINEMFSKKKEIPNILCVVFANLLTKDIVYLKCHNRKEKRAFEEEAIAQINRFKGINLNAEERQSKLTEQGR